MPRGLQNLIRKGEKSVFCYNEDRRTVVKVATGAAYTLD